MNATTRATASLLLRTSKSSGCINSGSSATSSSSSRHLSSLLEHHQRNHHHHQQHGRQQRGSLSHAALHTYAAHSGRDAKDDEEKPQRRQFAALQKQEYHTTARQDRTAVTLILGLGALSATSYAASTAVKAWKEYKESLPEEPPQQQPEQEEPTVKASQENADQSKDDTKKDSGERTNIFKEWFGVGVGAKYYEGGFEETMTRREAALILGVRESSDPARIKDAHRRLLVLNHPDTGGSTYVAGKINEAKELLLKGRRG